MKTLYTTSSVLLLVTVMTLSYAEDWHCTNQDLEIHCDSKKCEISESFTPMSVSVNINGNMTVCAYSGCFEGKGKVLKNKNHVFFSGFDLKFSTSNSDEMTADFLIGLDKVDKVAMVKGFGYAMPMICH